MQSDLAFLKTLTIIQYWSNYFPVMVLASMCKTNCGDLVLVHPHIFYHPHQSSGCPSPTQVECTSDSNCSPSQQIPGHKASGDSQPLITLQLQEQLLTNS